jgi:acetolactate synthase-1/2/3 large subunit
MTVSGGEILLDLLQSQGVETIFCSPGSEWTPVWEALLNRYARGDNSLKYMNCRHEMLAVSMAMGYAESTGGLPAVLLHSGFGVLHGSMAIRNAYAARVPMIIFSGETCEHTGDAEVKPQGWHWLGLLSDIEGPASLVNGYVKWSNSAKSKDHLADLVSRGSQIARSIPRGPVFLSVTPELLLKTYPEPGIIRPIAVDSVFEPHPLALEEAAAQLVQSKQPILITEYAGKKPGSVNKLVELAELLSIPVFECLAPFRSNFPKNNSLYMGFDSAEALKEADTVFVVGSVIPWYPPPLGKQSNAKVILLDETPLHENLPYWGYPVDIALAADIEQGLTALIDRVKKELSIQKRTDQTYRERFERWQARHKKLLDGWEAEAMAEQKNSPISSKWFLHEARQIFPIHSIIVDETILANRFIHRYLAQPNHFIKSGYGCLGVGVGEAVGVKMACPENPVILFIGDGAFNYNPVMAGLGLCQEYHLPVFIIIMNNGGYMAMRHGFHLLYPKGWAVSHKTYLGVDITPSPDYAKLAAAFDAYGERLEKPEEIEGALIRGLEQLEKGKTVILDVLL